MSKLVLSPFQERGLRIPAAARVVCHAGGRGSGKSTLALVEVTRHCAKYGPRARVLIARRTALAMTELQDQFEQLVIRTLEPDCYVRNRNAGSLRFISGPAAGALVEFDQIDQLTAASIEKHQGKSKSLILTEEASQHHDPKLCDFLFSSLRAEDGVDTRMILTMNPGSGAGAAWIKRRTFDQAPPWTLYTEKETGLTWCWTQSTYEDNLAIDRDAYGAALRAGTSYDMALQAAWLRGDWSATQGAFFADCFDRERNVVEPWQSTPRAFRYRVGADWGTAAPAYAALIAIAPESGARGPDGFLYPARSAIIVAEAHTAALPSLTQGTGDSPTEWAATIWANLLEPYSLRARAVSWFIDPQANIKMRGQRGAYSVASELGEAGLPFKAAARSNRVQRMNQLRSLMRAAGTDGAGLYVCRNAEYLLATLPMIQRSPYRPEDLDTSGPDHAIAGISYGLASSDRGRMRQYAGYGADAVTTYTRAQRERDERNAIIV